MDEGVAFYCSECGSALLVPDPEGTLTCAHCGVTCEITGRTCLRCGAVNPLEAEHCTQCGQVMDLVGFILQSRLQTTARERLEKMRAAAARLKEDAEIASQERLRRWWAEEEERRRTLAAAQAERDRQERMLLRWAMIFAAGVILAILIYLLVTALLAS